MKRALLVGTIVLVAQAASADILVNPGFETGTVFGNPDVPGAPGWATFGNVYNTSSPNPGPTGPHSGTGALKQFGTFPGVSGAFQSFSAVPGQVWSLSGYGLNSSSDAMQLENFGILKISFQDAAGTELLGLESARITIATPLDQWQFLTAIGTAPAGTSQVRLFALFVQPNFNGGSAFFDDLSAVPAPGCLSLLAASGMFVARRRRR